MSGLFLKLLNMSISASVLIVVVVLARCLLRKSPKWIHCILWALVGIRLLCPFQLETTFSLAPNAQVVSIEAGAVTSQVLAEMPALDNTANRYLAKYYFEGITIPEQETAQNPMNLIASIWLCGVAVLLVYAAVSYVHIRRKVRESVRIEGNIYICDRIQTPFIFGVLNPRIYLPSSLKEVQIKNVVAHEKAHIRRLDYLWKPLGYVLFAVYWFNPFCWLAYILFCRDIEMACDERVIKDWSAEQKKEYSLVLLSFHVSGKMITVCPLAFGEVGVKQRVKGILNFKKPTFWLIAAALLFCVIIGALFLTNPKKNDNVEENIATELSESSLTDQTLNTEKDSLADQESELNALLKKQSDAIRAQQQSFLQTWADAFCDRDEAAIDSLCMDGARKKMMKEQLLVIDEGDTIFGWSSPWPMWDTSDENSEGQRCAALVDGNRITIRSKIIRVILRVAHFDHHIGILGIPRHMQCQRAGTVQAVRFSDLQLTQSLIVQRRRHRGSGGLNGLHTAVLGGREPRPCQATQADQTNRHPQQGGHQQRRQRRRLLLLRMLTLSCIESFLPIHVLMLLSIRQSHMAGAGQ